MLVDEEKRLSRERDTEICIQRRKSLRSYGTFIANHFNKKMMDLLTSEIGELGLWEMTKKIRVYGRRSDGGHNVGLNVAVCDNGLRRGDFASSCNSDIGSGRNSSSVNSSSSNIVTNNVGSLGL